MPILDGMVLEILYSCLGAWIQDFKCHDAKRGIAGTPVANANYGVFGQALIRRYSKKSKTGRPRTV
jgi:hypothetical protein